METLTTPAPARWPVRTARAALLIGGGRVLGLAWPLLISHQLGVSAYGRFAVAVAVAGLITVPLDSYYLVRAPRTDDATFRGDQTARVGVGAGLALTGVAVWALAPMAGFSVAKSGFDILFNARKSEAVRSSRPDRALAEDVGRQLLSLTASVVVVVVLHQRSLPAVGACYLVGYLPLTALVVGRVRGRRPRWPERTRTTGLLLSESALGVVYLQGDVVVLGWLLDDRTVGYYSLASTVAQTAGLLGQSFAATFHDRLREHDGATHAGPPRAAIVAGAALCGLGMLGAAGLLGVFHAPPVLIWTFVVFAGVAATRFVSAVFTTVLTLQSADRYRVALSVVTVTVKFGVLLAVASWGCPAVALGFLAGDLVATVVPVRRLYRPVERLVA